MRNGRTARRLIREGVPRLEELSSPKRLCETILSELLERPRTALYLEEEELSEGQASRYFELLEGLKRHEPLQYLLGKAYFLGEPYRVDRSCFIPRPDTELLVEACLDYFPHPPSPIPHPPPLLFIDVGTGSGCIAISLTKRIKSCKMLAIDVREDTLRLARENGKHHGVSSRISWICGDLFGSLKPGTQADAILSNPPYIPTEEIPLLPPEVRREPRISLEGGEAGLSYYKRLAGESHSWLRKGGTLFLEIGDGQSEPVAAIFREKSPLFLSEIRRGILGTPRVMIFRKDHG